MRKHIGADMRLGFNGDIAVRPEFNKRVDNILRTRVLDSGCEFAVRKSACAAFTEHNITVCVQQPLGKERFNIRFALRNGFPSFDNNDLVTAFGKFMRCKKTGRAESDNNSGRILRNSTLLRFALGTFGKLSDVFKTQKGNALGVFGGKFKAYGVDAPDVGFIPCVKGMPCDAQ